ncbi:MAG: CBS domain-containing protein [Candidatus Nitrosocaldus sp.]|nr:CBS domain-containing protein [Candidatus Nitrosocaldus sp.]MDW8000228.1 CBS domain-containing protein [Candidatus Nitrosocaldus sp.]
MSIASISVKDVMSKDVKKVSMSASIRDAITLMTTSWVSSVIVLNSNNEPVGIFTEKDAIRAVAWNENALDTRLHAVMSTPLLTVDGTASLETALSIMVERGINHLPVTHEGEIVGMITSRDIVRFITKNRLLAPEVITEGKVEIGKLHDMSEYMKGFGVMDRVNI